MVVPGRRDFPLVTAWAGESVYLLDSRWKEEQEPRVLHFVYDHPVTCVDVSSCRAALGIKSCGWGMNDGGNKVSVSRILKKKKCIIVSTKILQK